MTFIRHLLLMIILIPGLIKSQEYFKIEMDSIYKFINRVIVNDSVKFNLEAVPNIWEINYYKESIFDDTIFTQDDINFIKFQIKEAERIIWSEDKIINAVVIDEEKLNKIFRNENKGWKKFNRKFGNCLTTYSIPIFSLDYDYCIFYEWVQCHYLMGYGSLSIYRKESDNWIFVKTIFTGISDNNCPQQRLILHDLHPGHQEKKMYI
jgi:hypothetical protein